MNHPATNAPNAIVSSINWGAKTSEERGPLICFDTPEFNRNIIGAPSGAYAIYAAMAQAMGRLSTTHRPNFDFTDSEVVIPASAAWHNPYEIVSLDPLGYEAHRRFAKKLAQGADIRPTITMTFGDGNLPDINDAIKNGLLKPDGDVVEANGKVNFLKISLDPVWYLPGIAKRLGIDETYMRESLVKATNGMYPELVTHPDMKVFLPPIGGTTIYLFGDVKKLGKPDTTIATRPHDECNGSDTFGANICTCRPFLMHGLISSIQEAQNGGVGLIVYNRKEGRALGEVIKLLVYNARRNQPGGDIPENYFHRTMQVAGVEDARLQPLMPDPYKWLGISKIDRLLSMSKDKYEAILAAGIQVVKREELPEAMIPVGAHTEMRAKIQHGYYSEQCALSHN